MKYFITLLTLVCLQTNLNAQSQVFTHFGQGQYPKELESLQLSGLKMIAIENALTNCKNSDFKHCAFLSEMLPEYNKLVWSQTPPQRKEFFYKTKASLKGIDFLPLSMTSKYTSQLGWSFDKKAPNKNLINLGIKYNTLKAAINKCHESNNDYCVIESTTYNFVNQPFYNQDYGVNALETSASAIVRGYRFELDQN